MKICPQCSFANDERFPTCVVCNTCLVDVPSTLSPDPDHPEHARRALLKDRHQYTDRQIRQASLLYALVVTVTAICPGLVFGPHVLALYFGSALITAWAVNRDIAGQMTASFLQGVLSVLLLIAFGPLQPFIFFTLLSHIVAAAFLWHWTNLIRSANR